MSNQIVGLVTGLVAVGIVLVVAFLLMGNLKDSDAITAGSDAEGAINDTLDALSPIGSTWLPLVVIFGMLGVVAVLAFGAIRIFGGR